RLSGAAERWSSTSPTTPPKRSPFSPASTGSAPPPSRPDCGSTRPYDQQQLLLGSGTRAARNGHCDDPSHPDARITPREPAPAPTGSGHDPDETSRLDAWTDFETERGNQARNLESMASTLGLIDLYAFYRMYSSVVHPGIDLVDSYLYDIGDGRVGYHAHAP